MPANQGLLLFVSVGYPAVVGALYAAALLCGGKISLPALWAAVAVLALAAACVIYPTIHWN